VDAAAEAKGFRFWAEQGDRIFTMGSDIPIESKTFFYATMPIGVKLETRLLCNGAPVFQSSDRTWSYPVTKKEGTYRVEVYLKERTPIKKDIPWILSNPIFLKEKIND
jgi:hypothetical protein